MDLSPEAWGAVSAIGVALVGVWVEVVRRSSNRTRKELLRQTEPVANGFANDIKSLLTALVKEHQELREEMKDVRDNLGVVKGSQVDLHRRLDGHLEDHPPKMRRRLFG